MIPIDKEFFDWAFSQPTIMPNPAFIPLSPAAWKALWDCPGVREGFHVQSSLLFELDNVTLAPKAADHWANPPVRPLNRAARRRQSSNK